MLQLIQTDWGQFDLAFNATAVIQDEAMFKTLVYASLFTDAEADPSQQPDRYERRGWWAEPGRGSLIWWYRQQPRSDEVRRDVIADMTRVLLKQPALSDVIITDVTPARNVSSVLVEISAVYNGQKFTLQFDALITGFN